jgi:hypothetical protein
LALLLSLGDWLLQGTSVASRDVSSDGYHHTKLVRLHYTTGVVTDHQKTLVQPTSGMQHIVIPRPTTF